MVQPFRVRLCSALLAAGIVAVAFHAAAGPPVEAAAARQIALGVSIRDDRNPARVDGFASSIGGHQPALWSIWTDWLGATNSAFPSAMVANLRTRGIVPLVFWQPDDPKDQKDPVITYSKILAGQFDDYIRTWAQAARDAGGPVLVRFAHEMEGDWFPWGVTRFDNTPAKFIAAWRYIVTLFRSVGATNVKWVWSPYTPAAYLYPGDDYVDYVGFTAFNWAGAWRSMDELYSYAVDAARKFTTRPLIAAETGSRADGGDKAAWITNGYHAVYSNYPSIVAIVYFNVNMGPGQADWRLTTPPAALAAYAAIAADWRYQGSLLSPGLQLTAPRYSRSLTVPVTLTATDPSGHGIRDYYISRSAVAPTPSSAWTATPPTTFTLLGKDGQKRIYAWARSNNGSISPMASKGVYVDRVAPTVSLALPAVAAARVVGVTVRGTDSGSGVAAYFLSQSPNRPAASTAGWHASPPVQFRLAGTPGPKTLYAWTRDRAGNISARTSATLNFQLGPVAKLSAPSVTSSRNVPIDVSGTDARQHAITGWYVSETPSKPTDTSVWQTTRPTSVTLSATEGHKTLYAWVRADDGATSSPAAATILLDTTPPSVSISLPASSTSNIVAPTINATDAGSGVSGYYLSESSTAPELAATGWTSSPPASYTFAAGGQKTLYLWARDGAGNRSAAASAQVMVGSVTTYASDDFSRTISGGLGTAPIGGAWTTSATDFSTDGSAAVLQNPAGHSASALLSGVSAANIQTSLTFTLPSIPQGSGGFWLYVLARQSVSGPALMEYRFKVHIDTTGRMRLGLSKMNGVTETDLAPEVDVPGLSAQAGHTYRLTGQINGQQPSLQLRVWDMSGTDPGGWQISATDSSASPLASGATGLRTWLSSVIAAPLTVRLDDYSVTSMP